MGERQHLENLDITLHWSEWIDWDFATGSKILDESGVYEAKFKNQEKRLYIGETNKLSKRVSFLRTSTHHAGEKIRTNEDISNIEIRWAETGQYKNAERELLKMHCIKFGSWPKYNKQ